MKISSPSQKPEKLQCDLVVLPVSQKDFSPGTRPRPGSLAASVVKKHGKILHTELKGRSFNAKPGSSLFLDTLNNSWSRGILFLGLPDPAASFLRRGFAFQKMGQRIFKTAKERNFSSAVVDCARIEDPAEIEALLEGLYLASYRFEQYKSAPDEQPRFKGIREVRLHGVISPDMVRASRQIARRAALIDQGVTLARDLCNTPSSDCTPSFLARTAKTVARSGGLAVHVFNRPELEKMQANAILSVSQGSGQDPVLIRLTYRPKDGKTSSKKIIALVGKGVTFDTGGVCIKPSAGMEEMKLDMAGAAAVLGAMKVIAALKPSVEVRAYIPASENMVDGRGTRPGDVIRAMNGKTIEVINTDAEGRLLLADAMAFAEKDGCTEIVDLATLTGAAVVALGADCAGLFTPHDDLAGALLDAAEASREYLWRMPLIEEYREQMKSRIADLKNIGDKSLGGGSITGALFLQEFIKSARWAHLDIAGPALRTAVGKDGVPGASGYGVRTLVRYILSA